MNARETGEKIKNLRESCGESKRELARAIGVSYSAMCQYEYGIIVPRDDKKQRIAAHYGVPVGTIFFTDE